MAFSFSLEVLVVSVFLLKTGLSVIECPALTDVTNGAIVYVSDMTAPYDIGTTATHSCNSGYSLVGDEIRICGTNGEWDLSEPSCEPIKCPALVDLTNGDIVYASDTTAPYYFGTTATHSCNPGYSLFGDERRTCGGDGSSITGEWDMIEPTCVFLLPSQPTNVQAASRLMTSIQLSWRPPTSTFVAYYQIEYSYIGPCQVPNDPYTISMIDGRLSLYTITGLEAYSNYFFVITAVNDAGTRDSDPITASTVSAAPTGEVQGLTASQLNSTAILVEWRPVDCIHQNSRIVRYNVSYTFGLNDMIMSTEQMTSLSVDATSFTTTGLVPRSNYTFTVSAVGVLDNNVNAAGPNVTVIKRTETSTDVLLLLGDRFVPNNSIITFSDIEDTSSNGLFCITNYTNCCRRKDGSSDGRWHFPDSAGVTLQSTKLTRFTYIVRGPSKVVLRRVSRSSNSPAGIYRCEIPINHGLRASFYVGIYATNAGTPSVDVEISYDSKTLTLTCTSSGGPATIVVWSRNGQVLQYNGSPFSHSQIVNNTETSTYLNILKATKTSDFVGSFACRVVNDRGTSNTVSKMLGGVQIIVIGSTPFTVGDTVTIQCVSDIPAKKIRWLHDNQIVNQGHNISRLSLTFDPVNDSLHGVTYTCVVDRLDELVPTTANTTVTVEVPMNAISTTIASTELQPAVGNMYTLACVVTINVMGLSQSPNVHWFHNGNEVKDTGTTSTKAIIFSALNTSHTGNYTCSGNISTPAPPYSVVVNKTRNITLQLPPPTVILTEQSQTLYANVSDQTFTCQVSLAANVDTDVQVNITWVRTFFNGDENKSTHSIRLNASLFNRMGTSMLELQDLSSKDDKLSCTAILIPLNDTFLKASDEIKKTTVLAICPDLPTLTNGAITYSPTSSPRLEGTTATHSCDNGYVAIVLSGGIVRTCQSGRTWSGVDITCQPITVELISPSDPPAAGERYSIMCAVTRPDKLNLAINYQWFKTTNSRTQVGTNSPTLTFDPLVLSDAGQYSCEVTVSSSLLSQDIAIVSQHYRLKFITLNIQLRFNGVRDCGQYTLIDPTLKTDDITAGLSTGINNLCNCGFNASFITNAFLRCFNEDSPQHVTYRAILSKTVLITTVELVSYIEQWFTVTRTLVVRSVQLGINTTCPVVILKSDSPECPQAIEDNSGDNVSAVGGAIAGVLLVLLIAAAIVILVFVVNKYRRTKSHDAQNSTAKIETQSVPLGELSQPQPYEVATTTLSDSIHQQVYETIATSHEYEDVKFLEGVGNEQVGSSQTHPPEGGYDYTHCPAYLPTSVVESQDPQS